MKAAKALKVTVDPGPYGKLSLSDIMRGVFRSSRRTPRRARPGCSRATSTRALSDAEKVLEMEYTTDMVCHATMEPINATVYQASNGAWHVYTGTQSTSFARMTLTALSGEGAQEKAGRDQGLSCTNTLLGGGFGGKQDYDEILAAAYCVEGSRPAGQADPDARVAISPPASRARRLITR